MSLSIRRLQRHEETRFLERIIQTSWHDLPASQRAQLTEEDIAPSIERVVRVLMSQGKNLLLVADLPDLPNAGQLWLGEAQEPYTGIRQGYIYDLFVEPQARGQGIGEALLQAAEEASRQRGDQKLAITVARHNDAAQRLYQAFGFQTERLTLGKELG